MKTRHCLLSIMAAIAALPFIYGGCVMVISSGDSDYDKDRPEPPPVAAPAVINAGNAVEFAAGAIAGGRAYSAPAGMAAESELDPGPQNALRTLHLPMALAGALRRIGPDPAAVLFSRSDRIEEKGTVPGSCGGRFVYALDFERGAEAFSGDIEFEDFCGDRIVVSKRTRVSGFFDRSSGDIVSARFTFEELTADGLACKGDLQMDLFTDAIEATMNVEMAFKAGSAAGFTLSDYSVGVTGYAGFTELDISGTYIDPEQGAVALNTTDPFIIYHEDRWPASGIAVVSGQGATSAALTVVDYRRFAVAADTNGSGRFGLALGMHPWGRY